MSETGRAAIDATRARRGSIGLWRRLPLVVGLVLAWGCRGASPDVGGPAEASGAPDDAEAGQADMLAPEGLAGALEGVFASADTMITVDRAGRAVMLRDERRLAHASSGDFHASVRRVHAGAEAGDSDERMAAVRIGSGYWTRGNAGPWVAWDDAIDEPDAASRQALSATRDMMSLVRQCGRIAGEGPEATVSLRSDSCSAVATPGGAPWAGRVLAMDGTLTWKGPLLVGAELRVRMQMTAGDGGAEVTLAHEYRARTMAPDEAPQAPPADRVVSSRRDRPARMVQTVLQGWEDALGAGAPPARVRERR